MCPIVGDEENIDQTNVKKKLVKSGLLDNKTSFQAVSRTYGTESGIFDRGKNEVNLVLKLRQQTKIKNSDFLRRVLRAQTSIVVFLRK